MQDEYVTAVQKIVIVNNTPSFELENDVTLPKITSAAIPVNAAAMGTSGN